MPDESIPILLRDAFGVEGRISRLPGENENYLVESADLRRFVVKIGTNFEARSLALEKEVVRLVAVGTDLRVPSFVMTRTGHVHESLDDGRRAVLLEFIDGDEWGSVGEPSRELCEELGQTLARVAFALAGLEAGDDVSARPWDLTLAGQHRGDIVLVADPAQRRLLEAAFHVHSGVLGRLAALPSGFIHGDANDENVLVESGRVVGLIDFGDCLYNPLVCELAIALSYIMQRSSRPFEAAARVVKAYRSERELTTDELDVLFPLVLGRLAVTVTMCAKRRRIDPDRSSWFASEETAWALLKDLEKVSPTEGSERLRGGGERVRGDQGATPERLTEKRRQLINPALSLAYEEPLKIVRGRGQYLYDHRGRPFLDLVNNVCHVGHCHPRVVEAGQRQMAKLNTNTRYLYDGLTDYAERLTATLPDGLDTCFFVNSGSEANELALRLARAHTGRRDVLVVDGAYHGHTSTLIAISPYKFKGPGGDGRPEDWVHIVPVADGYRGRHKGQGRDAGMAYAAEVGAVIERMSRPPAAFISESLLSCGGQVIPPAGYFEEALKLVRRSGGLVILDEVQVGFARVGESFWAFETFGVVPDVVVMGKPIGNGHPLAAVVTRREIAASFDNGMEFFATFGGNPVSCAIGMAVLDVIEDERLQQHAHEIGKRFKTGLQSLMSRHEVIGDVRGLGLFLGVELVHDRNTLVPAAALANHLVNRLKERGILLSTDGPLGNVIKIKPPMVLSGEDVDMVVRSLSDALSELGC